MGHESDLRESFEAGKPGPGRQIQDRVLDGFEHGSESGRRVRGTEAGQVMTAGVDQESRMSPSQCGFGEEAEQAGGIKVSIHPMDDDPERIAMRSGQGQEAVQLDPIRSFRRDELAEHHEVVAVAFRNAVFRCCRATSGAGISIKSPTSIACQTPEGPGVRLG